MLLKAIENGKPINQWVALNRILFLYKVGGAAVAGLCALLVILCLTLSNRNPIVAIQQGADYTFVQGTRRPVPLGEDNIKRFVEEYVGLAYQWDTLDPNHIGEDIAPLVTDNFRAQEIAELSQEKDKDFMGKKVKQSVAGLGIQITKDSTVATFDVVLRVDNVPLVVPTQVSFQLVQGDRTQWNPLGLYVAGEIVYQGK